jgi:hypothetical protein
VQLYLWLSRGDMGGFTKRSRWDRVTLVAIVLADWCQIPIVSFLHPSSTAAYADVAR